MLATQLNITNYRGSVFIFGKNTFSFLAFSYGLSKVVSQQSEYVFFGAYDFGCAHFLFSPKIKSSKENNYAMSKMQKRT